MASRMHALALNPLLSLALSHVAHAVEPVASSLLRVSMGANTEGQLYAIAVSPDGWTARIPPRLPGWA